MINYNSTIGLIRTVWGQTVVTLRPGEVVCDQNITLERWAVAGLAIGGMLILLYVVWVNSAIQASLTNLSRYRLQVLKERQHPRTAILEDLLERPALVTSTISLINTACLMLVTALAILAVHQFNLYGIEVSVIVLGLVFLVLSLAKALPKGYALNHPETSAIRLSGFISFEIKLTRPFVWLVNAVANFLLKQMKLQPIPYNSVVTEEELSLLAQIGKEEGLIEAEEQKMLRSIFEFGDSQVREVMTTRLDIEAIPIEANLEQTVEIIVRSGKSRLPVYQPDIDHIKGVLYAKDLLECLRRPPSKFELAKFLRPAYYVPESKKVDRLFSELQTQHVHIAIIVDEYGGTAGMVTIEDLLEVIVGEIQDEYDTEIADFERISPAEVLVDARLILEEVNDFFDTKWQSDNIDTIGGFVYDKLGQIPAEQDHLTVDNLGRIVKIESDDTITLDPDEPKDDLDATPLTDYYRITVMKATNQRLHKLRLEHFKVTPPAPPISQATEQNTTGRLGKRTNKLIQPKG